MLKKILNITLALTLVFLPIVNLIWVNADSKQENVPLEEHQNLNQVTLEDVLDLSEVEEKPKESDDDEEIKKPPKELETLEDEFRDLDLNDVNIVDEINLEEAKEIAQGVILADGYILYGTDGIQSLQSESRNTQSAVVRVRDRVPNTTYDFNHIAHGFSNRTANIAILEARIGNEWVTAFCVEVDAPYPNGESLVQGLPLTTSQRELIELILMYGYGNLYGFNNTENLSHNAYVATQSAIWEVASQSGNFLGSGNPSGDIWRRLIANTGITSNGWGAVGNSQRMSMYHQIRNDVRDHLVIPSFTGRNSTNPPTQALTWNANTNRYEVRLTDTNQVLDRYYTGTSEKVKDYLVERKGHTITISTTNPNAFPLAFPHHTFRKTGSGVQTTLFWTHPEMQNVVTGSVGDPVSAFLRVEVVQNQGEIQIQKRSGENASGIPNTTFEVEIYDGSNWTNHGIYTTESNGNVVVPDLLPGRYRIRETSVPSPYRLDSTWREVNIDHSGNIVTETFVNQRVRGRLRLEKRGEQIIGFEQTDEGIEFIKDQLPLAQVTFNIYAREDITLGHDEVIYKEGERVGTYITNENGEIETSDLPLGKYMVKEIKAPAGIFISDQTYDFELTYEDQNAPLVLSDLQVENQLQAVQIELEKIGEQKVTALEEGIYKPLGGVVFGLFTNQDFAFENGDRLEAGTLLQKGLTDENGYAVFTRKLPVGAYYVQELSVSEEYVLSDEKYEFEFKGNQQDQEVVTIKLNEGKPIENQLIRGGFELLKVSQERPNSEVERPPIFQRFLNVFLTSEAPEGLDILTGVEFELWDLNDEVLVEVYTTDTKGRIFEEDLVMGEYKLVETVTADRHQLLAEPFYFSITEHQVILELEVANHLTRTEILKINKYGNPLTGATLQVLNSDDEVVEEWVSTEEPHEILGLAHGDYLLREVKAPSGFVLMEDQAFTVTNNPETMVLTAVNELTQTEILKVDEQGNSLAGATLQVINSDEEVVEEWVSTEKPHEILGLAHGDYWLREIIAPSGYVLMKDQAFTVTDHPETMMLTAVNVPLIENKERPVTGIDLRRLGIGLIFGVMTFIMYRSYQKNKKGSKD